MVRAHVIAGPLAALLLAACPADDVDEVDAGPDGDAGESSDADVLSPGLLFVFRSEPNVPGEIHEGDFPATLSQADIALQDIRSFGDAAPGDERTTQAKFALHFASEPGANQLYFPEAPPSRYSHLAAQIQSYVITGTVVLDQDPIPFTIADTPPTPLSVYIGLEGVEVTDALEEVEIEVNLESVVEEIDWGTFGSGATSIEIDETSPLISGIRSHLAEAFDHDDDSRSYDD